MAILYTEPRAMHGAHDQLVVGGEELIRLPVEADTGVRATVDITMDLLATADDEDLLLLTIERDVEALAARVGNLIQPA